MLAKKLIIGLVTTIAIGAMSSIALHGPIANQVPPIHGWEGLVSWVLAIIAGITISTVVWMFVGALAISSIMKDMETSE